MTAPVPAAARDTWRDQIAAALSDDVIVPIERAGVIAAVLPVLADVLDAAAEALRQHGVGPEVFVVDDMASALRAGGE